MASAAQSVAASAGAFVMRNPVAVGGAVAFAVTLFFVSANAVWYQPHPHSEPYFATRDFSSYRAPQLKRAAFPVSQSRVLIREAAPAARPAVIAGDPVLARVQKVLNGLKLYDGTVDGLNGPQTREAVADYQRIVGLPVTGEVSSALLDQIDGRGALAPNAPLPAIQATYTPGETVPVPMPAPRMQPATQAVRPATAPVGTGAETTASVNAPSEIVKRVQAGLRSFGNDNIEIDGMTGTRTRSAIREFQALFGLTETGEADQELVAKMQEIGLVN